MLAVFIKSRKKFHHHVGAGGTILINIRNRIQVSKSTSVPYIWFTRWKWYLYSYVRIEESKSTSIPYKYDLESKPDNCFHIKNTIQCKWRGYEKGLYKTWILPNRLFKKIKLYHYPFQSTSSFAFSNGQWHFNGKCIFLDLEQTQC